MSRRKTRRQFLARAGAVATGAALTRIPIHTAAAGEPRASARAEPRVVIARDDKLTRGKPAEHRDLIRKLLDASMQRLTHAPDAATAWRQLFKPADRVGVKVNTLGLSTQPAVVDAIVAGLRAAGVPAEQIVIWDRFDIELGRAGYKLNKSTTGVQCRGTDAERYGSGYEREIETSGQIGSCFSRIIAREVDTLISVPVLKDHNLAGVSLGLKNFFGAIHNPNKYHGTACDPYVADVVAHRYVRPRWRLTVCDGTHAQYHGGPTAHPAYAWAFGGLIVGADIVAVDAVGADLLNAQRRAKRLNSVETRHIATAAARGFGEGDLSRIERVEV